MSITKPFGKKIKIMLRAALPQIVLLLIVLILDLLASRGVLPSSSSIVQYLRELFARHGLPVVAVCSFLENIVGVNAYFPGSIAILAGMALAGGNPALGLLTYLAIVIPAGLANIISYLLGRRFKGVRGHSSPTGQKKGWTLFFTTYWHPHLAATTSFLSGANGLPIKRYVLMFSAASLFWSALWGLVMYHFGENFINREGDLKILVYGYLIVWVVWGIYEGFKNSEGSSRL